MVTSTRGVASTVLFVNIFAQSTSGGPDPCMQYTDQYHCEDRSPLSMNCTWVQGDSGSFCRTFGCNDIGLSGVGDVPAQCQAFGGCTYDASVGLCLNAGQSLPCTYITDPSVCIGNCVWDSAMYTCYPAGYVQPCSTYYESTSCPSRCLWTPPQPGTICNGVCSNSTPTCTDYEYADQQCCPESCQWVNVGTNTGQCFPSGQIIACEAYIDGDSCDAPRCVWHPQSGLCSAANRQVTCDQLTRGNCYLSSQCSYITTSEFDGYCVDCTTSNCSQPIPITDDDLPVSNDFVFGNDDGGSVVDSGLPCTNYSSALCPIPRCYQDYDDDNGCGGGVCRAARCEDFTGEQLVCGNTTGCAYEPTEGVCYNTTANAPYPCGEVFEQSGCTTAHGCTWQPGTGSSTGNDDTASQGTPDICYNTATGIPCSAYSASDAASCPSPCHWESVQQKCMNQNQVPTCKSYGSDSSCPLDRCQVIQGICWDQGSSPTCTNFCAPDQCTNAGGCKWDDSTYSCSPCPNGACSTLQNCSTYTSSVSCPSSRCYWTIDDAAQSGTAGFCGPLECVEVTTAALCAAKSGCVWNPVSLTCWIEGVRPPCAVFYTETTCDPTNCTWDSTPGTCLEHGETTPCHFYYTQSSCPSGCSWDTSTSTCELSLSGITTPPLSGTGNHDPNSCSDTMLSQYSPLLARANVECSYSRRFRRQSVSDPTTEQLKCLDFIISSASPPVTLNQICPCLWRWADEYYPQDDHWFRINC